MRLVSAFMALPLTRMTAEDLGGNRCERRAHQPVAALALVENLDVARQRERLPCHSVLVTKPRRGAGVSIVGADPQRVGEIAEGSSSCSSGSACSRPKVS